MAEWLLARTFFFPEEKRSLKRKVKKIIGSRDGRVVIGANFFLPRRKTFIKKKGQKDNWKPGWQSGYCAGLEQPANEANRSFRKRGWPLKTKHQAESKRASGFLENQWSKGRLSSNLSPGAKRNP
jgi:hypothetical protein